MTATADYSGWVRELDEYQHGDRDDDDPRHETTAPTRGAAGLGTSRGAGLKGSKARAPPSQADELQQEMKLLNWHKLANEAALKAAIIKTNKVKREDAHFASALVAEDREERVQRAQQIIEEEQLRPLQVNSDFFRDFEAKGQRDDAKLEDDVQRHIQHLKRLKDTMATKEDAQRRRRQYRDKVQDLHRNTKPTPQPRDLTARKSSNQEDEHLNRYQRIADAQNGGRANAEVVGSLDKLMELEKRIRHLEDAGLGADALDEEQEAVDADADRGSTTTAGIRFAKRRSSAGPHEPSRTVYAVQSGNGRASKMRSKDARPKSFPQPTANKKRGLSTGSRPETFLTSLPDSKQRQLRRMTERERRQFLKAEKAAETKQKALKQDVVIEGWMDKKRQAATQRKAANSHVRGGNNAGGGAVSMAGSSAAGSAAQRGTTTTRKATLPPPPRVRAPAVGAASGKRISNPHMQKFDDIKKSFDRRKEVVQRAPTTTTAARAGGLQASSTTRRGPSAGANQPPPAGASRMPRQSSSLATQQPQARRGDAKSSAPARSTAPSGLVTPVAPGAKSSGSSRPTTKLPSISRADFKSSAPVGGGGRSGKDAGVRSSSGGGGLTLPRIVGQAPRVAPVPSPPPANRPSGPQFSRLHKR